MTTLRVITEELGGSTLARAAQRQELSQWYRRRPSGANAWRDYAREVARPFGGGAWLAALGPALEATGNAARRLERAATNHGVVVTTGQQAALFGGPLYTLSKALSALAAADVIERETGIATAPVFWAATDDADFQEASCAKVALAHEVRALCIEAPAHDGIPMSSVPLGDLTSHLATLAEACGSVVDRTALTAVQQTHDQGTTLGHAYVRLLRRLLEPLGIAVLDASHDATRKAAEPVLRRAVDQSALLEQALEARAAAIRDNGYKLQVEQVRGLTLVFSAVPGDVRRRLSIAESGSSSTRYGSGSLAPNVLLRPVVERAILPTVAYMAGPGEIAYFAQVSAVAETLGIPIPLVLPRWSGTIVEPRAERLLQRLGIAREDLSDPHAVESRLARSAMPDEIKSALDRLRQSAAADAAALAAADLHRLIPPEAVAGLQRAMLRRIERVSRRYAAALKRRESQVMRDVATARAALYPEGKRQERVLNYIPFLARNGEVLLDLMRREAVRHAATIVGAETSRNEVSDAMIAGRV